MLCVSIKISSNTSRKLGVELSKTCVFLTKFGLWYVFSIFVTNNYPYYYHIISANTFRKVSVAFIDNYELNIRNSYILGVGVAF